MMHAYSQHAALHTNIVGAMRAGNGLCTWRMQIISTPFTAATCNSLTSVPGNLACMLFHTAVGILRSLEAMRGKYRVIWIH